MLLSKLVFLCVKNVIYLNDTSFNYEGFVDGDFDNDIDYATNINNVFSPLNEAITRLSDLERIPYIVDEVEVEQDKTIDLTKCSKKIRHVLNVAQVGEDGSFRKLGHVMFGKNKVRIVSPFSTFFSKIYIEYKENIPAFSRLDIAPVEEKDGEFVDNNIDLNDKYGIDDGMCNYIMEYVQGKLLEPIAPDLANMHITRAETYFSNIDTVKQSFPQIDVEKKYLIGE